MPVFKATQTPPTLRDRIALNLRLDRSKALRVTYWLQRLQEVYSLAHADVGIVPFRSDATASNTLVATVDWKSKAVGCAYCGEWAADAGQGLSPGFKLAVPADSFMPYELRALDLRPAILYCADCFARDRDWIRQTLEVPPDAPDDTALVPGATPDDTHGS